MMMRTDVKLDGCVVIVTTRDWHDHGYLSTRFLQGDDGDWRWMENCDSGPIPPYSLAEHHEWARNPQSCARAVLRFKQGQ
jgi:hypothetical protein